MTQPVRAAAPTAGTLPSAAEDLPAGTVFGCALNVRAERARLTEEFTREPYKSAPRTPVFTIKPANTWSTGGAPVVVPAGATHVRPAAALGAVVGTRVRRANVAQARAAIAGWRLVNDLALPFASYYRPALRFACRDGFCVLGPIVAVRATTGQRLSEAVDASDAVLHTRIDGRTVASLPISDLVLGLPDLIAAASEFMTLEAGDLMLAGGASAADTHGTLASAGQWVEVALTDSGDRALLPALGNPIVSEAARA
jgi:5-oxopent-3-ene-1,2,5-tricarboxylate decarboxylase/2-hydroxyhepta-2,4-diene-1,7-dioate isomerase